MPLRRICVLFTPLYRSLPEAARVTRGDDKLENHGEQHAVTMAGKTTTAARTPCRWDLRPDPKPAAHLLTLEDLAGLEPSDDDSSFAASASESEKASPSFDEEEEEEDDDDKEEEKDHVAPCSEAAAAAATAAAASPPKATKPRSSPPRKCHPGSRKRKRTGSPSARAKCAPASPAKSASPRG